MEVSVLKLRGEIRTYSLLCCKEHHRCVVIMGLEDPIQGHSETSMALLQLNLPTKIAVVGIKEDPRVSCCLESLEKW